MEPDDGNAACIRFRRMTPHGRCTWCRPVPARVRLPQVAGDGRVEVRDEQVLLERSAAGEYRSLRSDDETVAVEDQLVLAAHGVAERQEAAVIAAAGGEQHLPLPALAPVIGRGREVDDDLRAAVHGRPFGRTAGHPDVLADGDAHPPAVEIDHERLASRQEVAALVEDGVVREAVLAVQRRDPTVGQDRGGVVEPGGGGHGLAAAGCPGRCRHGFRDADAGNDAGGAGRHLAERGGGVLYEARFEQEVFRRVAGERQLGKQGDVGSPLSRFANPRLQSGDVA